MKPINKNILYFLRSALSFVLVAVLLAGCGDSSTDSDPSSEFDIQISSTSSNGEILTDGEGNALYVFSPDVSGESMCEGDCISNWPVFHSNELNLGEGLNADNFGAITRSDGSSQTTFAGWPLYYFANDQQPGEINGDGVGDVWYAAKPDYSLMLASQQLVGHDGVNYLVDDNGNYVEGDETTSHIVDVLGRTLYIFVNDSTNTNNFTAEDFSNNSVWPIVEESLNAAPSELDASLFGTIDVYGRQQLTYKGWPLYYFGQDEMQRGNTKGVSFPQAGIWPVAQGGIEAAPGYTSNSNDSGVNDPGY